MYIGIYLMVCKLMGEGNETLGEHVNSIKTMLMVDITYTHTMYFKMKTSLNLDLSYWVCALHILSKQVSNF